MKSVATVILAIVTGLVAAQGSIDNSAAKSQLTSQAITVATGQYTITAADGTPMVYQNSGGQSYAPGSGSSSAIQLQNLGDGTMRISMGNNKCISAQWGGTYDWAGVLYNCAIGSGPVVTGLEPAKQHWLLVPAAGVANVVGIADSAKQSGLSSSKPSGTSKCKKPADWIKRHPQYVSSAKYKHPECASLLKRERLEARSFALAERDAELVKRAGGQYYIIAVDHLGDMATRALTKGTIKTGDGGNVASWALNPWTQGNQAQIFTVSPA